MVQKSILLPSTSEVYKYHDAIALNALNLLHEDCYEIWHHLTFKARQIHFYILNSIPATKMVIKNMNQNRKKILFHVKPNSNSPDNNSVDDSKRNPVERSQLSYFELLVGMLSTVYATQFFIRMRFRCNNGLWRLLEISFACDLVLILMVNG